VKIFADCEDVSVVQSIKPNHMPSTDRTIDFTSEVAWPQWLSADG
jgi:hypothetical protein